MPHEQAKIEGEYFRHVDENIARTKLTGERRDEVARILEIVAKEGLPGPRDLDAALDAIEQAFLHTAN